MDLQRLLCGLLDHPPVDLATLPDLARAGLPTLLRIDHGEVAAIPTLSQWETCLGAGRVAPVADDPNATMYTPYLASPIQAVAEYVSEHQSAEKMSEVVTVEMTPDSLPLGALLPLSMRPAPMPEAIIGRYRLEEELGQGGMGVVYRGIDISDGSRVAIKIIRLSDCEKAIARPRLSRF